jgi:hypothetical protein
MRVSPSDEPTASPNSRGLEPIRRRRIRPRPEDRGSPSTHLSDFTYEFRHTTSAIDRGVTAPPREHADLPAALDEILLTALATERADRYEDVVYFRDDLRGLADGR